ncbi:MAG: RAMP superfamily CRISPR-associated protein [Acidobacteriota bacterium]|nr:RAMP superfamily CRISPR-associated protein [Acidobacteriota bacterium]
MHKKLLNEATFHLAIAAEGPLLVKSGTEGWDPTVPDMQFIRTRHAKLGETIFIPGSSLKGTLRSYSEKIARTLDVFCCDPFEQGKDSPARFCGKKAEDKSKDGGLDGGQVYQESCVACRLYGSTAIAGRAAFADAYPTIDLKSHLTKRMAVAIDRVLGSVAVGPFDFEALTEGEFTTTIRLRNFELWQLGLLGLAVRDLCLGRIRVGYGKSRGFGSVSARLDQLELRSIVAGGLAMDDGKLSVKSIGALLSEEERGHYGITSEAETKPISVAANPKQSDELLGTAFMFEREKDSANWFPPSVDALLSECVKTAWQGFIAEDKRRRAK